MSESMAQQISNDFQTALRVYAHEGECNHRFKETQHIEGVKLTVCKICGKEFSRERNKK